MRNIMMRLVAGCALVSCAGGFAAATERHVPAEYGTIQAAIDAAVNGDTVIVADGVYTGPGNRFIECAKRITIRSASGPLSCVVDCEFAGWGFFLADDGTGPSVLDGFTIAHGSAEHGAGVVCSGNVTIRTCVFAANTAVDGGGAYCAYQGYPATFVDCEFTGNSAGGGSWNSGRGGGAYCDGSAYFVNCLFAENSANWGGAVSGGSVPGAVMMTVCTLRGNHAVYGGGAVAEVNRPITLQNCLLQDNAAGWYGGAIYQEGATSQLYDCTIAHNSTPGWGGGIYVYGSYRGLFNVIASGNTASFGNVAALDGLARLEARYSDLHGAVEGVWVAGGSIVIWGPGNIDADPLFISPGSGDFGLAFGSPCVDAGSNELVPEDQRDLDGDGNHEEPLPYDLAGNPRVARFIVDMGAYEIPFGDLNCNGVVDFGDINPFVLALSNPSGWQAANPGCEFLYGDINADGFVDFADINPFVALLTGS